MVKKRILLIEDEADMVYALTLQLEAVHYEVLSAADGQVGLDMARKEKPDLIILDLMLPRMDGYKICKTLKSNPHMAELKICFISAKTKPEDVRKGMECGADDYFTKPFSNSQLIAKVRDLVGK